MLNFENKNLLAEGKNQWLTINNYQLCLSTGDRYM